MSLTKKVAYNTGVQIAGRVVTTILSLVSVSYLTRYLGPAGYGNYSIAFLYSAIVTTVIDFGIYTIALREMSADAERAHKIGGTAIVVKSLIQLPLVVLLSTIAFLLPYPFVVQAAIAVAIASAGLSSIISSINLFFQHALRLDYAVLVDVLIRLLNVGLIITLIRYHATFLQIIASTPFSVFIGIFISIGLFVKNGHTVSFSIDKQLSKRLLKDSLPLGVVTILGYLHFKVDVLILSLLKSSHDVGIYALSNKPIEFMVIVPGLYMSSAFPIIANYYANRDERLSAAVQRSFDFLVLLGLPVLFGILATAPQITHALGGKGFDSAVLPMRVLALASFFSFINALFSNLAIIMNLQRKIIWVSVAGVLLNVGVNLAVIPRFSYTGAAWTTVLSEAFGFSIIFFLAKKGFGKINLRKSLAVLVSATIMFAAAWAMAREQLALLYIVIISAAVYAIALFSSKAVTLAELRQVLR